MTGSCFRPCRYALSCVLYWGCRVIQLLFTDTGIGGVYWYLLTGVIQLLSDGGDRFFIIVRLVSRSGLVLR